ncbi:MAG: FAD:protein FMN transferase [Marmoricola sp.]
MTTTPGSRQWAVWSTTAEVTVTDRDALDDAVALVRAHLAEVDDAVNRFRDDSEIRRPSGDLSPLFIRHLDAALVAARATDGIIDPTVGGILGDLGYDRDITLIHDRDVPVRAVVRRLPHWRKIRRVGATLALPVGTELDFGATSKALAADDAAALVADRLGVGVLVGIGGDIATAGDGPDDGWRIRVDAGIGDTHDVQLPSGAAIATSSTIRRTWSQAGVQRHHLIDPRTCAPAATPWAAVTVASNTCVEANIATTASMILGDAGLQWLHDRGHPARLVDTRGNEIVAAGWPAAERRQPA